MIVARALCQDRPEDLDLAFSRLGLPRAAREYLLEKMPHSQVLLTGLTRTEGRFLRGLADAPAAPGREEFPAYVPGDVERRPGTALLCGRRDQLERVRQEAARETELLELADALQRLLSAPERRVLRASKPRPRRARPRQAARSAPRDRARTRCSGSGAQVCGAGPA